MSFCFAEDIDDASYIVDDNSSAFEEEVPPDPELRTITYNTSLSSSDNGFDANKALGDTLIDFAFTFT